MSVRDEDESFIREQLRLGDEAGERAARPHRQHAGELLLEAWVQLRDDEFVSWVGRNFPKLPIRQARRHMQMALAAGYHPPQPKSERELTKSVKPDYPV